MNEGLERLWKRSGLTQETIAARLRSMITAHDLPGPDSLRQETVSDYVRGKQRIPLAWLPYIDHDVFDRPKGTLLRFARLVDPEPGDVRSTIMADPNLNETTKLILVDTYESAVRRSAAAARA